MATGDRKAPNKPTKVDEVPLRGGADPSNIGQRLSSSDVHTDGWTGMRQDPSTYLTTTQLAKDLENWATLNRKKPVFVYPESMYRWCKQWFGKLPEGRTGPSMGYRIPVAYKYVARVWHQTEDPQIRQAATAAILAEQGNVKPWVVTVANLGSTHYTVHEVANRVHALTAMARRNNHMIHALYVGDERTD